jgi:hypothetical protein
MNIERLQKVIADIEQQFTDCLQQIKTLAKKRSSARRSWRT